MAEDRTYDAVVVGVGAMGSAACYHLARRGASVLGLERFSIPHAHGSSHGESRMIRLCYFEHPDYVPLLRRAYELWDELEKVSGRTLLHRTGGLYVGPPEASLISGSLEAAREHGLPHEELDGEQVSRRYPQFEVPPEYVGVVEPQAGFLMPEDVIATQAQLAMEHGAVLHGYEQVLSWSVDDGGVSVRTDRGSYRASSLVACGGAWTARLVGDLGVELRVTRQVLGWVWPKQPSLFSLGTLPVWAIGHADQSLHYGFPMTPSRPGLKVGYHGLGRTVDPDTVDRAVAPTEQATFRGVLEQFMPQADGDLLSLAACLYTSTPDGHFIIDRHPHHSRLIVAAGFSGHGFKFASVVGEVLADLVLDGGTSHPIGFLSAGRFMKKGTEARRHEGTK